MSRDQADFERLVDIANENMYKDVKEPRRSQAEKLRDLIRDLDKGKEPVKKDNL